MTGKAVAQSTAGRSRLGVFITERLVLVAYFISVAGIIGLGAMTHYVMRQSAKADEVLVQTARIIGHLERLQQTIIDAESNARGFLITGDNRFRDSYNALLQSIDENVREFRSMTAENKTQQQWASAMQQHLDRRFAFMDAYVSLRAARGSEALVGRTIGPGVAEMTAIKKTIAEMKAEQNRLFIERNGLRDKHNSFLEVMLLLSIGAALAIVTAVFGYTHRMWKLRREAEEAAAHLAHHDSLTGLPNRRLLRDRIAIQTAQARRQKSLLAILYLDLDGFKQINDRLGHQAGDDLLRQVAERLKPLLRSEDTVARLGGDEFVVSLAGLEDAKYSAIIAERAIKAVGAPYSISGHSATVGVSVGIALYPLHGEDEASLLKRADDALYTAKLAGKGRYAMAPTQPSSEEKPAIPVGALAAH